MSNQATLSENRKLTIDTDKGESIQNKNENYFQNEDKPTTRVLEKVKDCHKTQKIVFRTKARESQAKTQTKKIKYIFRKPLSTIVNAKRTFMTKSKGHSSRNVKNKKRTYISHKLKKKKIKAEEKENNSETQERVPNKGTSQLDFYAETEQKSKVKSVEENIVEEDEDKENRDPLLSKRVEKNSNLKPRYTNAEVKKRALQLIETKPFDSDYFSSKKLSNNNTNTDKRKTEIVNKKSARGKIQVKHYGYKGKYLVIEDEYPGVKGGELYNLLKQNKFPFHYTPQKALLQHSAQEPIPKCDNDNRDDPFYSAELINPVLTHLIVSERSHFGKLNISHALKMQPDISKKMRAMLLDWLVEVRESFRLSDETFFLSVRLIDLFIANSPVSRNKFQLLGCAAMFVASKFLEVTPPVANDFVYVADSSFSVQDLYAMENDLFDATSWSVPCPSHNIFLTRFLNLAGATETQRHFAHFLAELSVFETAFSDVQPSLVTSAAVFIALHIRSPPRHLPVEVDEVWKRFLKEDKPGLKETCGGQKKASQESQNSGGKRKPELGKITERVWNLWEQTIARHACVQASELRDCAALFRELLVRPNKYEHSVRRKYSCEKFSFVADLDVAKRVSL